jgi:hypothetical protein
MNAGQLAALIAAAFFAVGTCAGVYVLLRLAGLISAATRLVAGYQTQSDELMRRARAAVDRADEQLARTGALAESVDKVSASMSDLSEQVSAVAGTARLIAAGLGTPVLRLAAAGHGVRHAFTMRRMRSAGAAGGTAPAEQVARTLPRHAIASGDRVTGRSARQTDRPRRALRDGAGR